MGVEPAARRGLDFAHQLSTPLPSTYTQNLHTRNNELASAGSVHAMPPNALQCGYRKSAFQPVRPLQDESISVKQENAGPPPGGRFLQDQSISIKQENTGPLPGNSMFLNASSCNDMENVYCKPVSQARAPSFSHAKATPFNNTVFTNTSINPVAANTTMFPKTPDVNRSGDFNSSNLTGPSPTVCTKQALMEVANMFNGPLDSERDVTLGGPPQQLDQMDKDFEAAFSNDDCTTATPFSTQGFGGMGRYRISHPET